MPSEHKAAIADPEPFLPRQDPLRRLAGRSSVPFTAETGIGVEPGPEHPGTRLVEGDDKARAAVVDFEMVILRPFGW